MEFSAPCVLHRMFYENGVNFSFFALGCSFKKCSHAEIDHGKSHQFANSGNPKRAMKSVYGNLVENVFFFLHLGAFHK